MVAFALIIIETMTQNNQPWYDERFQDSSSIGYKITGHLHHSQSPFQAVDIYATSDFGNMLVLDGCIMLTEAHEFIYHELLVHIPMFSHPDPKRVLIIGGGDGGTVREVLLHDTLEQVDMVEIDEEVVTISRKYLPTLSNKLDDHRVNLIIQDAIEFVKGLSEVYDVVLVDSTDPIGPGEGLFSSAFYQDILRSLKPRGIVSVQSESPFGIKDEVATIQKKMRAIFPSVKLYWGPIPCYPHGTWSFTYCSKDGQEPTIRRESAASAFEMQAKYYNRQIHQSAFVLPNFMKKF
jgi:spermidine synthase